jgi:hypothetical protein
MSTIPDPPPTSPDLSLHYVLTRPAVAAEACLAPALREG